MPRDYLLGEMSVILADLYKVAGDEASAGEVARLRRLVETGPIARLASLAVRGLELATRLCRDSLDRGDVTAFACQSTIGAELRDFSVCAGLIDDARVGPVR